MTDISQASAPPGTTVGDRSPHTAAALAAGRGSAIGGQRATRETRAATLPVAGHGAF